MYVSLFLKRSIQDVEADIKNQLLSIHDKVFGKFNMYGVSGNDLLASFPEKSFKDTVICIGDLERKSDTIPAQDILGLASMLKEHKDCNAVMIYNPDEFNNNDPLFTDSKDKTIDFEFTYNLSPEQQFNMVNENIEVLQSPFSKHQDTIKDYIKRKDIRDIRVIKHMFRSLNDIGKAYEKIENVEKEKDLTKNFCLAICKLSNNEIYRTYFDSTRTNMEAFIKDYLSHSFISTKNTELLEKYVKEYKEGKYYQQLENDLYQKEIKLSKTQLQKFKPLLTSLKILKKKSGDYISNYERLIERTDENNHQEINQTMERCISTFIQENKESYYKYLKEEKKHISFQEYLEHYYSRLFLRSQSNLSSTVEYTNFKTNTVGKKIRDNTSNQTDITNTIINDVELLLLVMYSFAQKENTHVTKGVLQEVTVDIYITHFNEKESEINYYLNQIANVELHPEFPPKIQNTAKEALAKIEKLKSQTNQH